MKPYRAQKVRPKLMAAVKRMDRMLVSKMPPGAVEWVQAARNSLVKALDAFPKRDEGDDHGDDG